MLTEKDLRFTRYVDNDRGRVRCVINKVDEIHIGNETVSKGKNIFSVVTQSNDYVKSLTDNWVNNLNYPNCITAQFFTMGRFLDFINHDEFKKKEELDTLVLFCKSHIEECPKLKKKIVNYFFLAEEAIFKGEKPSIAIDDARCNIQCAVLNSEYFDDTIIVETEEGYSGIN